VGNRASRVTTDSAVRKPLTEGRALLNAGHVRAATYLPRVRDEAGVAAIIPALAALRHGPLR
jgi:hypothetical protein